MNASKGAVNRTFFHWNLDRALLISMAIHAFFLLCWDVSWVRDKVQTNSKKPLQTFLHRPTEMRLQVQIPPAKINTQSSTESREKQKPQPEHKVYDSHVLPLSGNRALWSFTPTDTTTAQRRYQSQIEQQQQIAIEAGINESKGLYKQELLNQLSQENLLASCMVNLTELKSQCDDPADAKTMTSVLFQLGIPPFSSAENVWIIQLKPQANGILLVDK